MKVDLIAGARPNIMKVAPLYKALTLPNGFQVRLVHTGQHYDDNMYQSFFRDFGLPKPDAFLECGSGSHAEQTARIMMRYEPICREFAPDLVIVVGDVNSTLACALTAKKCGFVVAHVEAGLRSGDRSMPEEINRIATDAISDLHLTPSRDADQNLRREGIDDRSIVCVGNIMIDAYESVSERIGRQRMAEQLGLNGIPYAVMTVHRASNVDDCGMLARISSTLHQVAERLPLIFPVHPRTRSRLQEFGLWETLNASDRIHLLEPLGYISFMSLVSKSAVIITDSGGVQEETTYLGIPCLTLRDTTERPITVSTGTNQLVGIDELVPSLEKLLQGPKPSRPQIPLWDGQTAHRIRRYLREEFQCDGRASG